jgi:hypothetical protein
MKLLKIIVVLIFFSCNSLSKSKVQKNICFKNDSLKSIENISLSEIEKIKTLNGSLVQIEGFFCNEFENVALYPYKWAESTKALWLSFSDSIINKENELGFFNYKKVIVFGRINVTRKGHFNAYIASLDSVFCIKEK